MMDLPLHGPIQALANSAVLGLLLVLLVELIEGRANWNARTRYLLDWLVLSVLVVSPVFLLLRSTEPFRVDPTGPRSGIEVQQSLPVPGDTAHLGQKPAQVTARSAVAVLHGSDHPQ